MFTLYIFFRPKFLRISLGGLDIMEIELKNLIFEYQKFNSKKTLAEILSYFKDIICNISKKLDYEEANTNVTIELIVILKKINLSNCENDTATKAKIIHSLLNRRTDLFRKYVLKAHKELQLNLEILTTYNYNDDSNLIVEDLIKSLSEKQRQLIRLSFINQYSDVEISKVMHITRQAVGQLKKRTLNILRTYILC